MRTVGLLIESSRGYGRGLMRGIAKFVRMHNDWSIIYQERMLADAIPLQMEQTKCDGILARIDTDIQKNWLVKRRIPVVDLRGRIVIPRIPRLIPDDKAVAEMAAEHLLSRGSRHFAFCGFARADYSQTRRDYFCAAIRAAGHSVMVYESPTAAERIDTVGTEISGTAHAAELGNWLCDLPRQTGMMACNDICGRNVLDLCHIHGITVPDHVALIGVDNDEILCDLADPAMSSVILPTESIGFQAAELLAHMMNGEMALRPEILIAPIGIMKRRSTHAVVEDDPCMMEALAFIRANACAGINVDQVLDHLAGKNILVSRSTLDRHFHETLKSSPKEQITNARMDRVRQLLRDTNWPVQKIAEDVGMAGAAQLAAVFKHSAGMTLGEYRDIGRLETGPATVQPWAIQKSRSRKKRK